MNFLAHFLLSGNSEELMLGNFLGDFVKGNQFLNYNQQIISGIKLHRSIDTFTDSHPVVAVSKQRLRASQNKFAPVVVDVIYDHFLAANWKSYCSEPLDTFAQRIYSLLTESLPMLPPRAQRMVPYMVGHDWLGSYSSVEGISRALQGLGRRTAYPNNMAKAGEDLLRDYDLYLGEFRRFFPDLKEHVRTFIGGTREVPRDI